MSFFPTTVVAGCQAGPPVTWGVSRGPSPPLAEPEWRREGGGAPPPVPPTTRQVSEVNPASLVRSLEGRDEEEGYESDEDFMEERGKTKTKKRGTPGGGGGGGGGSAKRKPRGPKGMVENPVCGHCGTKTTPEWRTGPNGLILCNACGLQWSRKRQKRPGEK